MKTTTKPLAKAQKGKTVKKTKTSESNIQKGAWTYDKTGKIKPIKKMAEGGAADECAQWPGKPGCRHSKAQRINKRRKFWNSDTGRTIKKVGVGLAAAGAGAAAYAKNAFGVKDKVKDLMGQQKGGTVKKKYQTGGTAKKYQAGGGASIVAAMKKGGATKKKK
jgi:hypothetical protein